MKQKITNCSLWVIFLLYLALIIKLILFKYIGTAFQSVIMDNWSWANAMAHMRSGNYIPFRGMFTFHNTFNIKVLIYNIIAFGPFGLLFPLVFKKAKFPATVIAAAAFSLLLELSQGITILGEFDVNDIILNTFGAVLGYLFLLVVRALIAKHKKADI